MSKPAIIFDIGNVLVDILPRQLFSKMGADVGDCDYLEMAVFDAGWRRAHDCGRPFAEGVDILLGQHPEKYHAFIKAYKTRWTEMLSPVSESIAIFNGLHAKGYTLYGASNWSAETFPLLRQAVPEIGKFNGAYISGESGVAKPDARFFRLLIEKFRIETKNAFFIDDSVQNTEAAALCGLRPLFYENPPQLGRALTANNIDYML